MSAMCFFGIFSQSQHSPFLFELRLGIAVYEEGKKKILRRAQTVESTASNATQINVHLYSWIRCCQAVICDVAKSG